MLSRNLKMPTKTNYFLYWNCCRGVFNKKHLFEKYISEFDPVVFFIAECDIDSLQCTEVLNINGYTLEMAPTLTSRGKGRVMAYIKNGFLMRRLVNLENEHDNVIVVENRDFRIVGIYSGFQTYQQETIQSAFERMLSTCGGAVSETKRTVIFGDFNVNRSSDLRKANSLDLWSAEHGLAQLVKGKTRYRVVDGKLQESTLDLAFTNDPDVVKVKLRDTEASDHKLLVVTTKFDLCEVINSKRIVTDWRNFTNEKFESVLRSRCDDIKMSDDINEYEREITCAITLAMNNVIPLRVVHIRRHTDLISTQISSLQKKRDRLLKKARKTGNPQTYLQVSEINKEIKRVVKKEKNRVINQKLKNSTPSGFWYTVNSLLGRCNKEDVIPLIDQNGSVYPAEDTPDVFGKFFIEKIRNLMSRNPVNDPPVTKSLDHVAPFSHEEILKAIEGFQPKKSSGPDEVPLLIIKQFKNILVPHLQQLFQLITEKVRFPRIWKIARLKPVFKKGDKMDVNNYRPISNLCSVSKVFEKCILNRLPADIDGLNQHGFRPCHSTTTAALEIQSVVASLLDQRRICLMYSADLSAAFDLIRPGIFHQKAKILTDNATADLIYEFITQRKGFVELNGNNSSTLTFPAGCPQGSTLGPRVFNIYCSDLNDELQNEYTHVTTYADDTYVVVWSRSNTREELMENAKLTIKKHVEWLQRNGMVCNIEKTELISFGLDNVELKVNETVIKDTTKMKVLGLTFDNKLDWSAQVESTVKKCTRLLHGLRYIRKYFDVKKATQVITSFFFSLLNYGLEVWYHPRLKFHLKRRIRALHYKAMRTIYGRDMRKEDLDKLRATPDQMACFMVGKLVANIVTTERPLRLFGQLQGNSFYQRRDPWRAQFYDTSVMKIGKQCLKNRVSKISECMKCDWLLMSKDQLRINLKKLFFTSQSP